MAWETRPNGKRYFYMGRRVNGRVVKEYYGCGPAAILAEQQLEMRKQQRLADQKAVRTVAEQEIVADSAVRQLTRSAKRVLPPIPDAVYATTPLQTSVGAQDGSGTLPKPANGSSQMSHDTPVDPISEIQVLLARLQQGDSSAGIELETFLDQYPDLWVQMGDVGEQAINAWLTLVSGKVPVLALAARKKLDSLREELLAAGTDITTRLHADRVMATWLQVTHADLRFAQADRTSLPMLEFLAKRQRQAQQQHLSALTAWRMWRRAQDQMGQVARTANLDPVLPGEPLVITPPIDQSEAVQESWILPFPGPVAPRTGGQSATGS